MTDKKAEVQNIILLDVQSKYQIPNTLVFDKFSHELQVEIITKVKRKCKINVMGALYGDTSCTIYDFDNRNEQLRLNSTFYSFMQRFQRVLNYLTNYHLALFLEKFNEQGDTTHLLLKVENVSKRTSLDQFYQVLSSFYNGKCFYCGKAIKKDTAHVDYFIPWSFVQADQLWNLVIACSVCNLSKSDKLASKIFLDTVIERNEMLTTLPELRTREDMQVYTSNKLKDLYHYSYEMVLRIFGSQRK